MVQYSPLCNTSVVAYLAYLDSCNGQLFVGDSNVGRASGGGSRGYGGGNFGSDFVRLCVALCDKEREKDGVVGGEFGDLGVVRSFVSRLVDEVRTDEVGDAGFSGDCDGSDRGGVVGGCIYGCDKRGVQSAGEQLSNGEVSLDAEDVGRGKHWRKNKKKKEMKRQKNSCNQENGEIGEVSAKPKDALRLSLEKKWALENELRAAKAARELELLKSEDLGAIKKLRERKVQGATERTMVQIEKAHASLVRSGDVPGVQPGFCQTVVDGEIVESVPGLSDGGSKGCSISPSSSISEREVREMKKELEDLKAELKKEKKKNYRKDEALKVFRGEEVAVSVRFGDVAESAKDAFDDVCGKDTWDATGDLDVDPDTLYVKYEGGEVLGGYDYSY